MGEEPHSMNDEVEDMQLSDLGRELGEFGGDDV
jgi:hypothetical protein